MVVEYHRGRLRVPRIGAIKTGIMPEAYDAALAMGYNDPGIFASVVFRRFYWPRLDKRVQS